MSNAFACWLVLSMEAYESFHACHLLCVTYKQLTTADFQALKVPEVLEYARHHWFRPATDSARCYNNVLEHSPPLPRSDGLSVVMLIMGKSAVAVAAVLRRRTCSCRLGVVSWRDSEVRG